MAPYTPDRWVLVAIKTPAETIRKVFAGWYGGYAGADSWKLSSEVIEVVDHIDYYEFLNHSGSIYRCYKNSYGMSGYMMNVFANWEAEQNNEIAISLVETPDIKAVQPAINPANLGNG